jgi:integrase
VTADRVRGRIEVVLDAAKVKGLRDGENPARWRGHLALILPNKTKLKATRHHAAVAVDRIPAVYSKLVAASDNAALAMRFALLTASRPNETAGAIWDEFDLKSKTWTVDESRMKGGRPHRVALSDEALAVLDEMAKRRNGSALVFPGRLHDRPLTLPTLAKALRIANGGNGRPTTHGTARSSFDDFVSERTDFAPKLIDRALAHGPKNKTIAAYRRADLLEARRPMMQAWSDFCRTGKTAQR